MTYSVYQHWDPLKVCVVGRSYPPEFYSWIAIPHVRSLFEKIAIETEEDYQTLIKKLESFGVEVLRPDLPSVTSIDGTFVPPPMTPRDYTIMVGETFYNNYNSYNFGHFYYNIRQPGWPDCNHPDDLNQLPYPQNQICKAQYKKYKLETKTKDSYDKIFSHISQQGNTVKNLFYTNLNGAVVSRIGQDLYFGTESYDQDPSEIEKYTKTEFPNYRNHIVNTGGHSDGTYCPVCPGLIISLKDVPTYADTFPGWEVVYLPGQSWTKVAPFLDLKHKNNGKWWIPGFEQDQAVVDVVEQWLRHWTGYVEETVFDVNMLIIDPKNVMVFNYNKQVFDALDRYGITPHVVPFRHRYFWDGGIHCITSDLHREGTMQDYFPERN
jgi:glycine amidinotransferase